MSVSQAWPLRVGGQGEGKPQVTGIVWTGPGRQRRVQGRGSPKGSLEHSMRLDSKTRSWLARALMAGEGPPGRGHGPGGSWEARRWVPVRAKRGIALCGRPSPPRGLGDVSTRGCDRPQGRLGPVQRATSPRGGRGSEKAREQQGPRPNWSGKVSVGTQSVQKQ